MPFYGFNPPEPIEATLPLPSGAGATLPTPELFPEVIKEEPGLFANLKVEDIPLILAGLGDLFSQATGKPTNTLGILSSLHQGKLAAKREARAERTEERAIRTEERAIATQQVQEARLFVMDASKLAGSLAAIPDSELRTATMNAMVAEARTRGGERLATIVRGILDRPDAGKLLGPLLRHLPAGAAASQLQEGAMLMHAGKSEAAVTKTQTLALPDIVNTLFQRIDVIGAALRPSMKGEPIPLNVLEAAVVAANPNDAPGTNPELGLLRGLGTIYGDPRTVEVVGSRLRARGFEDLNVAKKVAEQEALLPGKVRETTETTAARLKAEAAANPFINEEQLLKIQKLREEVAARERTAGFEGLPEQVQAELRRDTTVKGRPTPDQVAAAIGRVETRLTERAVEAARQQGVAAAEVPARTPAEQLKRIEDLTIARSQITEMQRLAPAVALDKLVGSFRPWVNDIIQTGRIGSIPVPTDLLGKLTADQERFLALTQDYADTVLRLRSGAQINEQEFKRMLGFLTERGIKASTFIARLELQDDLLRVRGEVLTKAMQGAGYRAPTITPPALRRGTGGAASDLSDAELKKRLGIK